MNIDDAQYDVYALRMGSASNRPLSRWYYRYDVYGLPDEPCRMDFFFWALRNGSRTVLVDCGIAAEVARRKGIGEVVDAAQLLDRVGIKPADVAHVVLSHLHFDHVGNLDLFPNATFSIARRELEFWTGPAGRYPALTTPILPEDLQAVLALQRAGRLELVEEERTLFPGVRVLRAGGHTPGQLVTEVGTPSGLVVLASDAVHFDDELDQRRPFAGYSDIEEMIGIYEWLGAAGADAATTVVPGHEPAVLSRFVEVAPDCVDLTQAR